MEHSLITIFTVNKKHIKVYRSLRRNDLNHTKLLLLIFNFKIKDFLFFRYK